jgi:hypothetical protein
MLLCYFVRILQSTQHLQKCFVHPASSGVGGERQQQMMPNNKQTSVPIGCATFS